MNWKEFFKLSWTKIVTFFALIILASFVYSRFGFFQMNDFFLKPIQLYKSSMMLAIISDKYLGGFISIFGYGKLKVIMLTLIGIVTLLVYYLLSSYIIYKKEIFKDYKVISLLIFVFSFIYTNTIDKNYGISDAPALYGFPLTHYYRVFQPLNFLINIAIWTVFYLLLIHIIKRFRFIK